MNKAYNIFFKRMNKEYKYRISAYIKFCKMSGNSVLVTLCNAPKQLIVCFHHTILPLISNKLGTMEYTKIEGKRKNSQNYLVDGFLMRAAMTARVKNLPLK